MEFSDVRMSLKIDGESVTNSWVKKFDSSVTLRVEATPTAKYTVEAVLFTDSTGKVTRYAGASAAITTSKAGTISFETKKIASGETQAVQSGLFAGGLQMFYLTEDGRLYAWGSNADNVLGAGADVANVLRPTLVKENVAQISVCQSNDNENNNNSIVAAILTKDGEIMTIGANIGSLGRASGGSGWGYVDFDGNPVSVSVGYDHLLILDDTGTMWGIGNNSYGQLGTVNAGGSATELQKVATNVKMISAGRRNSAWIDNSGRCYVLGDARWNKFRSSTDNITTPYLLLSNVSYISSGEHEMILVDEEGRLYYAGWRSINGFGQGNGTAGAAQLSISDVSKASIHFGNMIILTERGEAYVYGINTGNAIGGTYTSGVPHKLVSSGVKDVAAGYDFIAYQLEDGSIKITGGNAYGQGGNGSTSEYVSSTVTIK